MGPSIYLLAVVAPFLYAATNHIDHILLQRYFKSGGVGTLILFSAVLSAMALPVLYFIDSSVLQVGGGNILLLFVVGCMNVLLLWCYLQAIFRDEPTVVVIFYQLVPVLGLVLGYFVLGETITISQTVAMLAIICGALILTVAADDDGRVVFKGRTAAYMLVASILWASESVLFKLVAIEENVWRSLFWEHVALFFVGVGLFIFRPQYRRAFILAWRRNSGPVLLINVANEALYIIGNSIAAYVVVLVPVSLTLLMNSFQPLFVLLLGFGLNVFLPNLGVDHVNKGNLRQKLVAIAFTCLGAYQLGMW